jgi:serine protease Do
MAEESVTNAGQTTKAEDDRATGHSAPAIADTPRKPSAPASVSSRRSSTAPRQASDSSSLKRFKLLLAAFALMVSMAAGFLGGWLGASGKGDTTSFAGNVTPASQQRLAASESQLISTIAKNVGPSVVSVDVVGQAAAAQTDPFGFGIAQPSQETEAAGTGIIISSDGLIVTNRHVVPTGTSDVNVTLSDGTELDNVKVVGRTSDNDSLDIAFLKIGDAKGHKLTPAEIGDSSKVQVGNVVVAIGNALGQFNNTVTSGIISGYGRSVQAGDESGSSVENLNDLFQTDAAINEGNSGGPLVNSAGQVVGINTAISGQGQNIGFAIPINDVNGLIKQVLKTGKFERSYLGVRYIPLTAAVAKQLGLSVTSGAYVQPAGDSGEPPVISGSPADKAGVQEKDIITEVDGTKIDQNHSLTSLIGRKAVGDTTKLTVLRDGKTIHLTATVGAAPES